MQNHYLLFTTVGELNFRDVVNECQAQGWVPILILRPIQAGGDVLIPGFPTREIAMRFAQRHLPKNHLHGVTILPEPETAIVQREWIDKRGWKFEPMPYARRMNQTHTIDVEVLELTQKPDIYKLAVKPNQQSKIISYAK